MKPYPSVEGRLCPILRVAMPRAGRLDAPAGTVHVVARCNNREFCFTTPADFEVLLARLREISRKGVRYLFARNPPRGSLSTAAPDRRLELPPGRHGVLGGNHKSIDTQR
jgi:hypothetical protein